ncbi:MAG TPA: FAD-dependent oxidoreductase [Rhizomicrobium sp.]|jgi:2-polyprenyl-6-methoxyphenol hydroxylase-like FAD-dependent oxidoreductase|nr:FAD-dependent oxidoreductase [Rhizomicrobium sp.]
MTTEGDLSTTCVVAGGGPAGMMCGYLLAHAGIDVTVLEKHRDFLRDFRGDTVHPSTLQVMYELGLLEEFLKRPHQEITRAGGQIGQVRVNLADFTHLPTLCKFIAFMPQWDFLNFLAEKAKALPKFHLMMEAEATDFLRKDERVTGVTVKTKDGEHDISAHLTICADGRHSVLRNRSGLEVKNLGAPIDVLWLRLKYREGDEDNAVLGHIEVGQVLVMLYRGDYWQCALVIPKGGYDDVRKEGIAAFRKRIAMLANRDTADEIEDWNDVKLLTVAVDRLTRWYLPGALFIGDAAHAMSPIGGVGINIAIQDAVAAANILAEPLRRLRVTQSVLARVEKRRRFPVWATQAFQVAVQNRVLDPVLASGATPKVPFIVRLAQHWIFLQRIPARLIGMGVRPEHPDKVLFTK